jgi:copper chaperone CopZ
MKKLILMMILFFSTTGLYAQKGNVQTVVIQTTAECGECEIRLEDKLNYTKGVQFAELDVPSKQLTVKFNAKKISLDEIRKIVSDLGYQADEVPADSKTYEALPACCKVGGMK